MTLPEGLSENYFQFMFPCTAETMEGTYREMANRSKVRIFNTDSSLRMCTPIAAYLYHVHRTSSIMRAEKDKVGIRKR
jgi:hypothetical protein